MAEGGAAGVETQRGEVAALLKTPLRKGDTWYLVDSRWFKQWKKYVGYDSWDKYQMGDQNVYPGPVDNAGLLRDGNVLAIKEHLIDELDYILVPTEGWNKLLSWYSLTENQEPISRKAHGPKGPTNRVAKLYSITKDNIRTVLGGRKTPIHRWVDSTSHGGMCEPYVTAYFIDTEWELKDIVLKTADAQKSHTASETYSGGGGGGGGGGGVQPES
ncbi:Ubiquitin carboxyl-terminal hydrolase 15 [Merluccius polli]|uniref:ubiquitinyl hydrolase 1 n=1 Tax=Merluccius polli TaxID=89951 RepID=A0AA47PBC0_MERPO|nr:Ubiquitin carboxyl-terminal hydrolase 15 [Merluccius polli]